GLRLRQQVLFVSDPGAGGQRLAVPVFDHYATLLSDPVHRQKADIVGGELVFDPRIAQPNDQLHCRYFLAGGGAAAGSAPSSSASCLPFLITSGSTGAAAAASAAASGVGATSSFTEVMCATVWSSSVMNFNLPPWGRSFTRSTVPKTSSLTSPSIWLGISLGRHSISSSRSTWSRIPPCCFTPAASPTRWMGTITRIFSSMAMRFRSRCSSLPFIGSNCQSTIMTLLFSLPTWRSKIVLCPDSEFRIREICLGSTLTTSVFFLAPYTTAGTRPLARRRRASFLPRELSGRGCASTSSTCA